MWAGKGTNSKTSLCPQLTCTKKCQPQRSCSSWTPAVPSSGTPWPRCLSPRTKITSCRSCTPLKTKACFQSPITHPCMTAFVFQDFCMEGRGALQSSCWLHLQLVKIRDRQMVSHQLFCSWPRWRQLGETNAPTTLITENSTKKRNRAPQSRTPTHSLKKKKIEDWVKLFCVIAREEKGKKGEKNITNLEIQWHYQSSAAKPTLKWLTPKTWKWGMSFSCRCTSHMCSLWCCTYICKLHFLLSPELLRLSPLYTTLHGERQLWGSQAEQTRAGWQREPFINTGSEVIPWAAMEFCCTQVPT